MSCRHCAINKQTQHMTKEVPKVFISYSWSSQQHQLRVKEWADRLILDGVNVILDLYDLKEGNDKFVFMERMVTDETVSHVLVICDSGYASKADARKAGVGTESQIISKEVYDKVDQSKFIPIACEFDHDGNPFLPRFFQSRIWINFTSDEAVNENWEQLIRLLFGKPQHQKPRLGKPPPYITSEDSLPVSPAIAKFSAFKQAVLQSKPGLAVYRADFIDACIGFADAMRVRQAPNCSAEELGHKIISDCGKLKQVRNQIVDWILLEGSYSPTTQFEEVIVLFLERLRETKARPAEVTSWNDDWFGAHAIFVYETFLYVVAALLKVGAYRILHETFKSHYIRPETEWFTDKRFDSFECFHGYSRVLGAALANGQNRYLDASAELIRRQADRSDLPFAAVMEAELLIILMSLLMPDVFWPSGTLVYSMHGGGFPLFLRATHRKGFEKLSLITGIASADELRSAIKKGIEHKRGRNYNFGGGLWESMNLEKLDSLR